MCRTLPGSSDISQTVRRKKSSEARGSEGADETDRLVRLHRNSALFLRPRWPWSRAVHGEQRGTAQA